MPGSKSVLITLVALTAIIGCLLKIGTNTTAAAQSPAPKPGLSFAQGKVCSGAVGGRFRDSVVVPDTYRISDCEDLAKKLVLSVARNSRGYMYELGCLTEHGYAWGEKPGKPPAANSCGWE